MRRSRGTRRQGHACSPAKTQWNGFLSGVRIRGRTSMWDRLDDLKTRGEDQAIAEAMSRLARYDGLASTISKLAMRLVEKARAIPPEADNFVELFLRKRALSSVEGRALMRILEALER